MTSEKQSEFGFKEGRRRDVALVEGVCGHCGHAVHFVRAGPETGLRFESSHAATTKEGEHVHVAMDHQVIVGCCPRRSCTQPTVVYRRTEHLSQENYHLDSFESVEVIYPRHFTDAAEALDPEVPGELKALYFEACAVEVLSPNSTAFLCGRLLERVLRRELGAKQPLAKLIDRYLEQRTPPAELREMMQMVRGFRNIAGHAGEDESGDLIDVDATEAAFTRTTTRELLYALYVLPARQRKMAEQLASKQKGVRTTRSLGPQFVIEETSGPRKDYPDFEVPEGLNDDDLPF